MSALRQLMPDLDSQNRLPAAGNPAFANGPLSGAKDFERELR
jgi:hypothetical protein